MSTSPTLSAPATDKAALKRSISNTLKGSAGNLVEWYDVYVYSVFAVYFESQFFSAADKNSTMYVWAIFAATFLMRPIGAWYFGRFADRYGRRLALTVSVTMMAACSFLIALTPTATAIGGWAALILLFARLLQGFATGGEYGTSATYMSEAAIPAVAVSCPRFHYVTLVGGHVLAQLTLFTMLVFWEKPEISAWGWRIAFGIGGLAAIVVFWLRRFDG
jgi:MHS family alpha-ketoglutarate permease-like MFS transporter